MCIMSTELVPINITSDIIASLGEQFDPVFSQIRIFGTLKRPVFVARDVEKMLGLSDLNLRHRPHFKEGMHYETITIPTKGGSQKSVALTEHGLYQAFFNSSMPVAEKYCQFIIIVMQQLRTQGVVYLEGALTELEANLKRATDRANMLDEETDRQHELIRELENARDSKASRIAMLESTVADEATRANEAETVADKTGNVEYVALLEKALMKTVYVYVSGIDDEEALDLPDFDVFLFRLSTKTALSRHHRVADLYMVNPVKQITILGGEQECSLTDLREMVEASNLAYLKSM